MTTREDMSAVVTITLLLTATPTLPAAETDWQLRRLMEPTPAEQHADASGRVFIYDGLHENSVNRAMEQQFHRIQSMMFVRTRIETEEKETEVEEDGCDE